MADIIKPITLELVGFTQVVDLMFQQGDAYTRKIDVSLTQNGVPYTIPTDSIISIQMLKKDHEAINNPCQLIDNKIRVTITPQMTAVAGRIPSQIKILFPEAMGGFKTVKFHMNITRGVVPDDFYASVSEFGVLDALTLQAYDMLNELTILTDSVSDVTADAIAITESANQAESIRVVNENERIANEDARNVYEAYNNSKPYVKNNKVIYDGSSYVNKLACTGVLPTNTTYWLPIASKGDKGDAGEQGIQGIAGVITDGSVTIPKLGTDVTTKLNRKADFYRNNKNLIDKSKVTDGYYVNSTNGNLVSNSGYYVSDYIEIEPSTAYAKNTYDQFAFYTSDKVFISGQGNNIEYFTTPSNAKYVRLSINKTLISAYYESLDKGQLEKGVSKTTYETGLPLFKREQILDFPSWLNGGNLIFVSKSGGDFTTIQGAVNAIRDSSATKRYTIVIMQGIYEEAVTLQTKYIDLVALSLGSVIIIDKSGEYAKAPIAMSSLNNLKNLIIIANHDNRTSYTGEPSYAVHHDYVGEGENYIDNCKLISYQSCAFGCGTHQNQQIHLKNCEMLTDTTGVTYTGTGRPTLLYHPKVTTATKQKLIVDNCRIKNISTGYSVLSIIDTNNNDYAGNTKDNRDTELAFYNNILWQNNNGKTDIIYNPTGALTAGAIDGYIKLSVDSYGNNCVELNA